ncbi:MAG: hypothetical protein ACJASM_000898 [Salibacteraceae bacterium]|jgi:hypothetical protein
MVLRILFLGIFLSGNLVLAGCADNEETYIIGNIGIIDVKGNGDAQAEASGSNCGMNWADDFEYISVKLEIDGVVFDDVFIDPFFVIGNEGFDLDALTNWLYSNNNYVYYYWFYPGNERVKEFAGLNQFWKLTITLRYDNFWTAQPKSYDQIYLIQNPANVQYDQVLCSGKEYDFNGLIDSYPVHHINPQDILSKGDSFSGGATMLTPSPNNSYFFEYICLISGYQCRRPVWVDIWGLEEAYFTDTPQSGGLITSLSNSSLMTDYIYSSGGNLEYWGTGIIQNGLTYFFDPAVANLQDNLVYCRTNNNGCRSDWDDTVFYVTPIITTQPYPTISYPTTFGGNSGLFLAENINGTPTVTSKFHFVCSDQDYNFTVTNPQVGLFYEWQVVYQNFVFATGSGISYSLSMPDADDVNTNVSSSLYEPVDHWNNNSLLYSGLLFYGQDIDNSGVVESDESFVSTYLGDPLKVMVRSYNAFNDYSNWTYASVGVTQKPDIEWNSNLCYDGNPLLESINTYGLYMDSLNENSVRSSLWDVNMNGVFEFDGSLDNPLHVMTNMNKVSYMRSQTVDSSYLYAWNTTYDTWHQMYVEEIGEVCYSDIDTINVVRMPIVDVFFSQVDTVLFGNAVQNIVSGDYFDSSNDVITWNWSDNSATYYGDTVWHYFNDLGDYSLQVVVIDSMGCFSDSLFLDNWFVDGVLSIDTEEKDLVKMYPVPVTGYLTIEGKDDIKRIIIQDLNGQVVYDGSEIYINLEDLISGVYVVKVIKGDDEIIIKKIVKL